MSKEILDPNSIITLLPLIIIGGTIWSVHDYFSNKNKKKNDLICNRCGKKSVAWVKKFDKENKLIGSERLCEKCYKKYPK